MLTPVDRIEITVLVDNELDPISPSQSDHAHYAGQMRGIKLQPINKSDGGTERGDAGLELRMDAICCAAHGLSLMITTYAGDTSHTILFDTGPEEDVWERNVKRLGADIAKIERILLSHWHRDHSGGMLRAVQMINDARLSSSGSDGKVVVDLHPDRPDYRGFVIPGTAHVSFEADPSFSEIEAAGGVVEKNAEGHTVSDGFFHVSGEIPRNTAYELGVRGAARYVGAKKAWEPDTLIMDERLVVCHLRGKGLVVFTGCSHAGVVNACRHALRTHGERLHGVVGGFHLADNDADKLAQTLRDLKELAPDVIVPGHCTGWRFKYSWEQAVPGSLVPCFVGTKYEMAAVE